MPPCSLSSAKSPWRHTPGMSAKYALWYLLPSASSPQKKSGCEGKGASHTSSPVLPTHGLPVSLSYTATFMPSPRHCSSSMRTGSSGQPSAKQPLRSVPPEMDANCTVGLMCSYTNLNVLRVEGEPVDMMVRSADRSKSRRGDTPDLATTCRYLAEQPKCVMRRSCAILKSVPGVGYSGLPSKRMRLAPSARPDVSQFHIIQPQVEK
mmetsp:Transcript_6494/g.23108  ORF Transcript_6494/g.23108 Transcript_6494/m.23108 type:complete len:207 (-) Transcript_6494:1104-1724(-)